MVDAASGNGGQADPRGCGRMEREPARSRKAPATGGRRVSQHVGGRRAAHPVASRDDGRLRWPAERSAAASALVGCVSARARPLCARHGADRAGRGRAQDDESLGAAFRAHGARRSEGGLSRRSRGVRSRARARCRDVREARAGGRWHRRGLGEWRFDVSRGGAYRRARGTFRGARRGIESWMRPARFKTYCVPKGVER